MAGLVESLWHDERDVCGATISNGWRFLDVLMGHERGQRGKICANAAPARLTEGCSFLMRSR